MKELIEIFTPFWTQSTSYYLDWSSENPSYGQCAVTALKVQELLGGQIQKVTTNNDDCHYFNEINGRVVDITHGQFKYKVNYSHSTPISPEKLLDNPDTHIRYKKFSIPLDLHLNTTLSNPKIEHIAIRDPNYVAGSTERPEVGIFVQTHTRYPPLNESKFNPGQKVYMKWVGGPIVAESEILSWHTGTFSNAQINKIRELSIGTNLFGLDDYWESVALKANGYYCVIRLSKEKWLDDLIYQNVKSYGSSWIYLDTLKKKIRWLSIKSEPLIKNDASRNLPLSLRFAVLKRDNFTCHYCGRKAPVVKLHVDHIIPWTQVKKHRLSNLVTACSDCNFGKGAKEVSLSN